MAGGVQAWSSALSSAAREGEARLEPRDSTIRQRSISLHTARSKWGGAIRLRVSASRASLTVTSSGVSRLSEGEELTCREGEG